MGNLNFSDLPGIANLYKFALLAKIIPNSG